MFDRAHAIAVAGLTVIGIGLTLFLANYKLSGEIGMVAGAVLTVVGVTYWFIHLNVISVISSENPPYTFHDRFVHFRIGVRGSKKLPQDVKLLVTSIQPRPTEPLFRADYPYHLPQFAQKDAREILFQLATTWNSSESQVVVSGIQMDYRGKPDSLQIRPDEIWDLALAAVSADAKPKEAWVRIDATHGKLRVRRLSRKPAVL